jgi:hypothetical protein
MVPEDKAEAKRAKVTDQGSHPAEASSGQGYVTDDSIIQRILPMLRTRRWPKRGTRINPEPPSLVAKVCEEEGRGELWLGPIPTESRMSKIMETDHSIQIYCLAKTPPQVELEPGTDGEIGMLIPDTLLFRCEMSHSGHREGDIEALSACFVNSLRKGDNGYIHCVSGISRAPMAAAILCSMLMGISFDLARVIISQSRNIREEPGMEGPWIDRVLLLRPAEAEAPTSFSCHDTTPDRVVVHATSSLTGRVQPICRGIRGPMSRKEFTDNVLIFKSVEEAFNDRGGRFCTTCETLLRASLRVEVNNLYNRRM